MSPIDTLSAGSIAGSVAGAGDVDNDGFADVIVGEPLGASIIGHGEVNIFSGQTGQVLHTFVAAVDSTELGWSVDGMGDVDGDGYGDVVIGAPFSLGILTDSGRAFVYSGQTGVVLYERAGGLYFGYSLAGAGDVDNDSVPDFIVGAPKDDPNGLLNAGRAYVYSGQTGALLHTFEGESAGGEFGYAVSGAGDVNDDGFADLIIGAPFANTAQDLAGKAFIYSGQDGDLLYVFLGVDQQDFLGWSVSEAGDVDADGFADVIVGVPVGNDTSGPNTGQALVFSGQTGAIIHTLKGEFLGDLFGRSVAGAGDVDLDGYTDLIVGAGGYDNGGEILDPQDSGRAYVYSGQTGSLLYQMTGDTEGRRLGLYVDGAGDVDGDSTADLVVGANVFTLVYTCRDTDEDGVFDDNDNCPNMANPLQENSDNDLVGDSCDNGITTDNADQLDVDGDGSGAACDCDDLDPAIHPTAFEICDGIDNNCDGYPDNPIFTGEADGDQFGSSSAGAGDVDSNGYDDIIVGAWNLSPGGRAYVLSGNTGDTLHLLTGEPGDKLGRSVAGIGDVDHDGYADFVVGLPGTNIATGSALVISGRTGDTIYSYTGENTSDNFGFSAAGAGDANLDGFVDFIIGTRTSANPGKAYLYSGQDGTLLYAFTESEPGDHLGASVAGAGDLDGDGYADVIVGAPAGDAGSGDEGVAYIYSGQTGALIKRLDGFAQLDLFGSSVAAAGDVDKDGRDDVIIGAVRASAEREGRAYVFSGMNWTVIWRFEGAQTGDEFGYSVGGLGDVNYDGFPDLIVGAPRWQSESGGAYIYSGKTGDTLWRFESESSGDRFGSGVASGGDMNGDGFPDLLIGAEAYGVDAAAGPGRVYLYSCQDSDQDGIFDFVDNCPFDYNPLQADADSNGVGDECQCCDCQADEQCDGLPNVFDVVFCVGEAFRNEPYTLDPNPLCPLVGLNDLNFDGVVNVFDVVFLVNMAFRTGSRDANVCDPCTMVGPPACPF